MDYALLKIHDSVLNETVKLIMGKMPKAPVYPHLVSQNDVKGPDKLHCVREN